MKKISCMISVFIAVICVLLCTSSYACAAQEYYENGYTYTVSSAGEATIVKADVTLTGEITTPVTLGGYPVTKIAQYGFKDCEDITGLIISENVTSVGINAFSGCDNLKSIYIPQSMNFLVQQAFAYCNGLEEFIVDEKNDYFSTDESGVLFDKNKTRLVQYPIGNSRTSYVLPESVVSVDNAAFSFCKNLSSVTFADNVEKIGSFCFSYCEGLVSVNIPDSVTIIDHSTFYECAALQQVSIGSGVKNIGESAFQWCDALVNITIPEGVTTIGERAFRNCSSLEKIELGSEVSSIGAEAFNYCKSLEYILVDADNEHYSTDEYGTLFNDDKTELIQYPLGNTRASYTIAYGVEEVLKGAFAGCADIESVIVSDSVKVLGEFLFSGCSNLKSVTLGAGVNDISQYSFQNCKSLEEIMIGKGVQSIGCHAFVGCDSMQRYVVDEDNQWYSSDEYGVLFDKQKVTLINYPIGNTREKYVIPDSVQIIEDHAFYKCRDIVEVNLGKKVTDIGTYSFGHCYGLEHITIYTEIKKIDNAAFSNCLSIEAVTYCGTQEQWNEVSILSNNEKLLAAPMTFVTDESDSDETEEANIFEFSDGVLFVSGKNPIESAENEYSYEWNQYAQMTDAIVIEGIPYIGENAFVGFNCLTAVVIDSESVTLDSRAFIGCAGLKYVVSFGDTQVRENAFADSYENINLCAEKGNEVSSYSQNVTVSAFYQEDDVVFFDDAMAMESYDLFNVIAALCIEYSDVNKLHFDDFTALDFQFLEWQNEAEAIWVDNLKNVTFSVKVILDNAEQIVSYNELCDLVSDGIVTSFYLVAESDESYIIEDTEVFTEPQNFIFRFLKAIVTLLNKLFKIFGKSK